MYKRMISLILVSFSACAAGDPYDYLGLNKSRFQCVELVADGSVIEVVIPERIEFDYDDASLVGGCVVADLAYMMVQSSTRIKLWITGHADEPGSVAYNRGIGQRRADSLAEVLVSSGVDAERIVTFSEGESSPLIPTASKERKNRRLEITLSM